MLFILLQRLFMKVYKVWLKYFKVLLKDVYPINFSFTVLKTTAALFMKEAILFAYSEKEN